MNTSEFINKYKLFWQYPAKTEWAFYEQNKNNDNFIGIPWATIHDKRYNLQIIYKLLYDYIDTSKYYYTCCQHIAYKKFIPLWKSLNINIVFISHKQKDVDMIDNIRFIPIPLYAVNVETSEFNGSFTNIDFVNYEKTLLYSFVGGYQPRDYMSNIREKIFNMKHPDNVDVINTGIWHLNDLVFSKSQNFNGDISKPKDFDYKTNYYNSILLKSKFTLCPSGSGPNSIRFWEALAVGSIPILLSDTLELPFHELWDKAIIRIPEKHVEQLYDKICLLEKSKNVVITGDLEVSGNIIPVGSNMTYNDSLQWLARFFGGVYRSENDPNPNKRIILESVGDANAVWNIDTNNNSDPGKDADSLGTNYAVINSSIHLGQFSNFKAGIITSINSNCNDLIVDNDLEVGGNIIPAGTNTENKVDVSGNLGVSGTLDVGGGIGIFRHNLRVDNDLTVKNDLNVLGNLDVSKNATFNQLSYFRDDVIIENDKKLLITGDIIPIGRINQDSLNWLAKFFGGVYDSDNDNPISVGDWNEHTLTTNYAIINSSIKLGTYSNFWAGIVTSSNIVCNHITLGDDAPNTNEGYITCDRGLWISTGTYDTYEYGVNLPQQVSGQVALYAEDQFIVAGRDILVKSDNRIKTNIVDIEDDEALIKFRMLKPKKYQYKHSIHKGNHCVYGFLAQDISGVIPEALNIVTEYVPNIYETATIVGTNVIRFSTFDTSELVGDSENVNKSIRIIDSNNKKISITLSNVIDSQNIQVVEDLTQYDVSDSAIFVYGEEVNNFHLLKKNAIWTLSAAALQEIDRQQQIDKAKISSLEEKNSSLEERISRLEAIINAT